MDISKGQFVVGNDKYEVHQMWNGNSARHALKWYTTDIWPSYRINPLKDTFKYFIPTDGTGGLQGNTDLIAGQYGDMTEDKIEENDGIGSRYSFDPAGGTFSVSFMSRQTSYWHKAPLVIRSIEKMNIQDKTCLKITSTSPTWSKQVVLKSSSTSNGVLTRDWVIYPDNYANDSSSVDPNSTSDFTINFSIGANNNPKYSVGSLYIVGFEDALGNIKMFNDLSPKVGNIEILHWYQKPNMLFYVGMDFVNVPSRASEAPTKASSTTYVNPYNDITFRICLFIEFGLSLDGGQTINWNQDWPQWLKDHGITTIPNYISTEVPYNAQNIPQFKMTYEVSGADPSKFSSGSTISMKPMFNESDYDGLYYKYFLLTFSSKMQNTELTNPEHVHQSYYVNKKELVNTSDKLVKDGSNPGKATANWQANSKSNVKFVVRRISTTDPWKCILSASLEYIDTDKNLKYIGSTDPSKRTT